MGAPRLAQSSTTRRAARLRPALGPLPRAAWWPASTPAWPRWRRLPAAGLPRGRPGRPRTTS
eukprot:467635-Alexandrium_andersonii.AAC.1